MDFLEEIDEMKPDIFLVNEDGNTPEKAELCKQKGIEYIVLNRIPFKNFPKRSTTSLRTLTTVIPYRIDLAGTWIDQPYVSKYHPGPAIVTSIEPAIEFFDRSGMASSTRKKALELWPMGIPLEKPVKLAKILFRYDNPPWQKEISGSQDALGMMLPGVNKLYYNKNEYWPIKIESIHKEETLKWIENHIYLLPLWPRPNGYSVLENTNINKENVKNLADAAEHYWEAIKNKSLKDFAAYFKTSFEAQIKMFPRMMNEKIQKVIKQYKDLALAWKLTGAGGGGYLILISEKPIKEAMKIKIRRKNI